MTKKIENNKFKCELIPTKNIKPNPKNPNRHSKEQIKRIAEIIKYQGFRRPLTISNRSGLLIVGHGRLAAAKLLKMVSVPVMYQDYADEKQEYSDMVADNSLNADWIDMDFQMIEDEVKTFDDLEIDMLGFKDLDIDLSDSDEEKEEIEDDVPGVDLEQPPITKLGDLIELDSHRLICGDCTIKENVDLLMNGKKADMVFTDPPYGVSYADKNSYLNAISPANRIQVAIKNDHASVDEMFELWCKVFNVCSDILKDKSCYYICSPQGGELIMMMMMQAINQSLLSLKHTLIWNKNNHVLGRCDYHYKHEPILYGWLKKGTHNFYGKGQYTKSVWDINKPLKNDLHPTMKPIELMENALLNSTKKKDITIDLFLGSGSTLIACEKTDRVCYGMELDPHYCDIIIKRYLDYTDNKEFTRNGKKEVL